MTTSNNAATFTIPPIFSFSALKSNQREIKNRSKEEVVHITENGNAAYVFCSEAVFEREKERAVADALCELQIAQVIEDGRADFAAGRVVKGLDEARARMEKAWQANG